LLFSYVTFRLGIGVAAAFGLYYLLTWEPPPIPNAGQGKTLNDAIILMIAHVVWDVPAVKIVVGLVLAPRPVTPPRLPAPR